MMALTEQLDPLQLVKTAVEGSRNAQDPVGMGITIQKPCGAAADAHSDGSVAGG